MIDSDNDYAEYEDDVPRRTGWVAVVYRWLLGIGVAVALVFGGVYLVYSFGIETAGPEQDGVPLIRAAKGPVKVRPADPGGLEVPNQGLGVYKTIDKAQRGKAAGDAPDARAPGPAAQQRSHPQGPVCHPVPTLMADTGLYRLAALNLAARKSAARKPAAPKSAASKPVGPKRSASAKRRVSVKPAVSTKPAVDAKPAERAGRPAANAAPAAAGTATTGTATTGTATGTAGADSRKVSGKVRRAAKVRSYRIQLGAFRTQAKARNHGRSLQRKHRSLLGRLSMVVERVDLGAKGVFYRLRTGPFANRQTARDLCRTLGKRRINCFLVSG